MGSESTLLTTIQKEKEGCSWHKEQHIQYQKDERGSLVVIKIFGPNITLQRGSKGVYLGSDTIEYGNTKKQHGKVVSSSKSESCILQQVT